MTDIHDMTNTQHRSASEYERRRWQPLSRVLVALCAIGLSPTLHAQLSMEPVPIPSGNPITEEKRVLGKILFWDEQLSSDDTVAWFEERSRQSFLPRLRTVAEELDRRLLEAHHSCEGSEASLSSACGVRGFHRSLFVLWGKLTLQPMSEASSPKSA